jgi:hypothetical protein
VSTVDKPTNTVAPEDQPAPLIETSAPSGMDLRPEPETTARISKKAGALILAIVIVLLGFFAYGGWRRQNIVSAAAQGGTHQRLEPARPDDNPQLLSASAPLAVRPTPRLDSIAPGVDPTQTQNQETNLLSERVVVRSPPLAKQVPPATPSSQHRESTPQEKALEVAYASEQQAAVGSNEHSRSGISRT